MKLDKEMIANMCRERELERLLVAEMQLDRSAGSILARDIVRKKEKVLDILNAEYEIEVTRK